MKKQIQIFFFCIIASTFMQAMISHEEQILFLQACIDNKPQAIDQCLQEYEARPLVIQIFLQLSDNENNTPLHLATLYGHKEVFKLLLTYKAEPIAFNKYHCTPLHLACMNGELEMTKSLLALSVDLNVLDADHETPLFFAAFYDQLDIAHLLLARGADPKIRDKKGMTPLDYAVQKNNFPMIFTLIEQGAPITEKLKSNEAIYQAVRLHFIQKARGKYPIYTFHPIQCLFLDKQNRHVTMGAIEGNKISKITLGESIQ